jgi:hypothetical protein
MTIRDRKKAGGGSTMSMVFRCSPDSMAGTSKDQFETLFQ